MTFLIRNLYKPLRADWMLVRSAHTRAAPLMVKISPDEVEGQTPRKDFWVKNAQLNRPMSPHLSIYKPQLTSTLSIFHRISGAGATVVLYGGGIGALFMSQHNFPEFLQIVQTYVPHSLITTTKSALAGACLYHTLNGIRHLAWDVGYGFHLKHLYLSGYVIVVLTAIGTVVVFVKSI